jgi:hypothetical protein
MKTYSSFGAVHEAYLAGFESLLNGKELVDKQKVSFVHIREVRYPFCISDWRRINKQERSSIRSALIGSQASTLAELDDITLQMIGKEGAGWYLLTDRYHQDEVVTWNNVFLNRIAFLPTYERDTPESVNFNVVKRDPVHVNRILIETLWPWGTPNIVKINR